MKPVFRHRIVPVEINVGNVARFECETEDAPNVSFKWFKDGHPMKEADKYRIVSRFSTSSLELLSPTKDDSGEYTCKASNQHGSDECSASLHVTGKSDACFLLLCWLRLELLLVSSPSYQASCCVAVPVFGQIVVLQFYFLVLLICPSGKFWLRQYFGV